MAAVGRGRSCASTVAVIGAVLLVACGDAQSEAERGASAAPDAEALAAHRSLHADCMERFVDLVKVLEGLAEQNIDAGAAAARVEEIAGEATVALEARGKLATPESARAVYEALEPRRKEVFDRFVAVTGRLREHGAILIRAQKAMFDTMNATRFDAPR